MNMNQDQLDKATQSRLGKLSSMPVDLSRIEKQVTKAIGPESERRTLGNAQLGGSAKSGWLRVAAVIALLVGVSAASYFAFFHVAPSTAVAQTMTIVQLHQHLLDDPQATYRAQSAEQAQEIIDAQLSGELALPIVDGTRVESCCLVDGHFPLRAALVVDRPGGPITIIIAQGEDFAHPMAPIEHPSGVPLQGHEHAGMHMVMRNAGDLWMCVMGEQEEGVLADTAALIAFSR